MVTQAVKNAQFQKKTKQKKRSCVDGAHLSVNFSQLFLPAKEQYHCNMMLPPPPCGGLGRPNHRILCLLQKLGQRTVLYLCFP